MIRVTPGLLKYCDDITDDILIAIDHEDKILSFEIYFASMILHVFGDQERPLFTIHPTYDEDSDILKFNFVNFTPPMITLKKTEMEDIKVEMDDVGKIVSVLFYNASNRVLKTVSEEERVRRDKEVSKLAKERSEKMKMEVREFYSRSKTQEVID